MIVDDWNDKAYQIELELEKRKTCDIILYVITPLMEGVYSIAEVVDDSNKRPEKTILCILNDENEKSWLKAQRKSLDAVEKMVENNGALVLTNLNDVAKVLNL